MIMIMQVIVIKQIYVLMILVVIIILIIYTNMCHTHIDNYYDHPNNTTRGKPKAGAPRAARGGPLCGDNP